MCGMGGSEKIKPKLGMMLHKNPLLIWANWNGRDYS